MEGTDEPTSFKTSLEGEGGGASCVAISESVSSFKTSLEGEGGGASCIEMSESVSSVRWNVECTKNGLFSVMHLSFISNICTKYCFIF